VPVITGVKVADNPERVNEKSAEQLDVCAELLKLNAEATSNSANNFFINKILISNVALRFRALLLKVRYHLS
jgi:hypothetical protein